ncbi:MAG TPA: ABC transporter ATP-binding protein [Casimicrobiaceae bacterium]|nr:ABC transporter ATP-binding protein [Casimicrobiaceae bacterium]
MTSRGASLAIRQVSKAYDGTVAIESVDLDVHGGELVTLLGPSGSGKTTLLMSIAGFAQPDSGEIIVNGCDISLLPPHKRGIGVVFQQYALLPHLTIEENVAYPLRVRGVPRQQRRDAVAEALSLVRLEGFAARRPSQLSGGQQQRVALARALVFRPPVLLMDEPLGALDRKLRGQMQLEIRNIQRSLGITTVYVTHDQEEALAISDRIAIMHAGRIEQVGAPETLYKRPATAFIADFMGESNLFAGYTEARADGAPVFRTASGLEFRIREANGKAVDGEYLAVVRPEQVQLSANAVSECPFRGTIHQLVYLGAVARVQITVRDNAIVHATVAADSIHALPGPGQEVWFGWRSEPVLVPSSFNRNAPIERK